MNRCYICDSNFTGLTDYLSTEPSGVATSVIETTDDKCICNKCNDSVYDALSEFEDTPDEQ